MTPQPDQPDEGRATLCGVRIEDLFCRRCQLPHVFSPHVGAGPWLRAADLKLFAPDKGKTHVLFGVGPCSQTIYPRSPWMGQVRITFPRQCVGQNRRPTTGAQTSQRSQRTDSRRPVRCSRQHDRRQSRRLPCATTAAAALPLSLPVWPHCWYPNSARRLRSPTHPATLGWSNPILVNPRTLQP